MNNLPITESQHQASHHQAVALLNDLEDQRKRAFARQQQQINDLNRQIQYLQSENASLRTASSVPGPASLAPGTLADELDIVARRAQRLGFRTQGQPKVLEVEILGFVLCHPWRLENLQTFMREEPQRQHPDGAVAKDYYCLRQVGLGARCPRLVIRHDGHVECGFDANVDFARMTRGDNGADWVIGSRA